MAEQPVAGFASLLRQLRAEAGLTQEELAEAAGLSPRTVSDLERGVNRTAHKDTAGLLADALGLAGPVRGVFVAAARGRVAAGEVLAARAEALDVFAGNLPVQLSSFVGRAEELAELAAAMRRFSLVTVVGVGGVGKTRLALRAAAQQLPSFRDGAWLCELNAADDGETMAQAVLAALRVRPRPGISMAGSIVEFLRTKSALLLVVDNCEHLLSAVAALVADILRRCRGVRILATSRQALGVGGEQVFGLRPLSLPPPAASMATVGASDAVSLFVQRAAAARRDFSLSPSNVAAVCEICTRLDGIPLAIELAAARVAALRPADIAGLLDERFRLLTSGRADVAGRQQTLQATVEWSYALLGEDERHVFDCLGVFPGSFDAAAAAAVADAGGLERWDILDSLTALVGKSMVVEEEGPDQTSRYRLLETMRAYARQQLAATGKQNGPQRRHAEHYMAFAERAGPELLGPLQLSWQNRIRAELDNLQAAVTWALTGDDQTRQVAFRIVSAGIAPSTVGAWTEAGVAQIGPCPPEIRATLIASAAWSAFFAGDLPLAQRLAREGRHEAEKRSCEVYVGFFLAMEAMAWTDAGDPAAARRPAMDAVEVARRVRNPMLSAVVCYAAAAAIWIGEPQTAWTLVEESLALTRVGAFDPILGFALSLAGAIRARNGDLPGALTMLQEATVQTRDDGNRLGLGMTLERAAAVLAQFGEAEPAAVLGGADLAHFALSVAAIYPDERLAIDEAQVTAHRALGEAAYSSALGRGAAMDDDEVTDYALGEFRRIAALIGEPGAQAPESPSGQAELRIGNES